MRVKKLQWAGNAARMFGNIILKRMVEGTLGGRRPDVKPRNRWKDEVLNDTAKLLSAKNWRVAARQKSDGRKKQGRPWPENGPKNHTKKRRKKKKKKPNGYFLVQKF